MTTEKQTWGRETAASVVADIEKPLRERIAALGHEVEELRAALLEIRGSYITDRPTSLAARMFSIAGRALAAHDARTGGNHGSS